MRLALDANRYVDLAKGDPAIAETVSRAELVALPFVALAELRAGFRGGRRSLENERALVRFLQLPHVTVLWPGDPTTRIWADLFAQLRAAGTPIPMNDLWIAALVVEHGLLLSTRDAHFSKIPQLALA